METFSTFIAGKIVVTEAASGRVKNKPLAPIPALTKAKIKHSHNQSAFKKNKTMVGVSDKDYDKAKKLLSNMPNVMLHTEENIKENPVAAVGGIIVRAVARKAVGSAVKKAASSSSNNESVNEMHCKDCGCEKGNIDPNCDCTNDGSAPATAEHWVSGTNEARQMKNKDTEMMVTLPNKKGGVKTIDAKDWPQFKKRGYVQAENVQQPYLKENFMKFNQFITETETDEGIIGKALGGVARAIGRGINPSVAGRLARAKKKSTKLDNKMALHKTKQANVKKKADYKAMKSNSGQPKKKTPSSSSTTPSSSPTSTNNVVKLKKRTVPATAKKVNSSVEEAMNLNRLSKLAKMAKASPAAKKALNAPSRVDNNKDKKNESVENINELSAADKKLINLMYDKKGKLTKLGKKVMDAGQANSMWRKSGKLDERNYRKEYDNYQGKPEQIANRSSRNSARRIMGDDAIKGMDVGHKDNNPLNNDPSNLQMEEPSENRREPRLRDEAKAIVKKDRQGSGKPMSGYDKVAKKYGVKPIKLKDRQVKLKNFRLPKEEVEEKYTGGNRRDWAKGYDFDQDTDIIRGFVSPKAKNLAKKLVKSKTPMAKATKNIKSKFPGMSVDSITNLLKTSGIKEGARPGLWDNISKRRAAGKAKAKPGDKNYPKTLDIGEGKMNDLAMKIDNVVSNMKKDRIMKPFADKFKKDAMKSLDIRKSLEKILPDYVAGKMLDKVMVMSGKGY